MTEFSVRIARRADREIRAAISWWRENRTAAPHALEFELAGAIRTISIHPQSGRRVFDSRVANVRRLSLNLTHYYLFYRVGVNEVTVLSLRHQARPPRAPLR